ncbi:MAG: competence/damage-inducible protein A, partial [Burkholderiaceae bacterium]|nr:competence/damage-inducible protein A [Burkholderiaceae bacterium]
MEVGLVVVGDEILSGKRRDRHFPALVEILGTRGMHLGGVEYIGDDPEKITATLRRSFSGSGVTFVCGGIGSTPDDHTRRSAARALGVELVLHPEAEKRIGERIAEIALQTGCSPDRQHPDNIRRMKMGEFPVGSHIIPNRANRIPGFFIRSHYFLPGFPEMAHPMMEWVLDTYYREAFNTAMQAAKSVMVYGTFEAVLTPLMEEIEQTFPSVRTFSLPSSGKPLENSYIELG